MLQLRVTNTSTYIDGDTDQELRKALRAAVGFMDESSEFRAINYPGYDGMISTLCYGYGPKPCKCAVKKRGMHFPSGLLGRVIALFEKQNIPYNIVDHRPVVDRVKGYSLSEEMEERDYQITGAADCIRKTRGLVKMSTGSGKTSLAARLIVDLGVFPFIFFVPSKELLKQAHDEFARFIRKDGKAITIGQVGGGHRNIEDITVMTVQTARLSLDPEAYIAAKQSYAEQVAREEKRSRLAREKAERKAETLRIRKVKEQAKATSQSERIAAGLKPLKKYEPTVYKEEPELEPQSQYDALEPEPIKDDDDEVDGTEEFEDLGEFRNAVRDLVHNCKGFVFDECHHCSNTTCQTISDHAYNARYRYGFSATPKRDQGDDLLIDACFGKSICDINASFLIDRGYLVPPTIYFIPIRNNKHERFDDYSDAYVEAMVENEVRNNHIANIATKLSKEGRTVLILIKHIRHGNILNKMIPGSVFVHGSHSSIVRDAHLTAMREHRAPITIASTIYDEGIDVRPLDCVINAGGGKSPSRALQRVGRALRPYAFGNFVKKDAVIIEFMDDSKWFREHSYKRRQIYLTEPRFIIKDLKLT